MKRRAIRYRRYVHSKWAKTKVLLSDPAIGRHIPPTKKLTAATLEEMLHQHKMVYVKPSIGAFGNGVIRVEWRPNTPQPYRYQRGLKKRQFDSFGEMSRSLLKLTSVRSYLIQQGIHLLTYRKKRFDIRVMVQKNTKGNWETTGIIGRVGDPRKVVTNVHNGGTLVPVEKLMEHYLPASRKSSFLQELRTLGVKVGQTLTNRYPGLKEIGIDVAVDNQVLPWILEVNTAPDPYIFRKLPDKRVFRKVYAYWKRHRPKRILKPLPKRYGLGIAKIRRRK
ncbi:YheC/YheD family protein [Gordoniibacillus kamchatkensis]|uniref:YheC/YheD family protein n=1 Tax=Gordoniibacillus kamchatkensis TaxID=1590651 RepID=UPI0009E5E275|nr:YheC/YheD family protein [Paenibacillus sp. VKM B-2647]